MNENTNKQIDVNIKSRKQDIFAIAITLVISIFVLVILVNILMTNSKVNEGKFRASDVIVISTAVLEDTREDTQKWTFNAHQKNVVTFLVEPFVDNMEAYITDIASTKSGLEIYQAGNENLKINIDSNDSINLTSKLNEDGKLIYEIAIVNLNVLKNFEIPNEINEIMHDATIFEKAGLKNEDLEFLITFKLNIKDSTNKLSVMNVTLELPSGNITSSGSSVNRLDLSQFIFKVK